MTEQKDEVDGMRSDVPTLSQYQAYRAYRRQAVRRIASCIRSGTVGLTDWSRAAIARLRKEHSQSVARQAIHGHA